MTEEEAQTTGWLMGPQNDVYAVTCEPCAKKAVAAADKAREASR